MLPETRAPSGGRLIRARPRSVLPHPVSPTIPSASPGARSKLTRLTAGNHLPSTASATVRSRTERMGRVTGRSVGSIFSDGLQFPHAVADVPEMGVEAVDVEIGPVGVLEVARGLVDRREVVEESHRFGLLDARRLQALAVPLDRELRHPLLQETEPEHAAALHRPRRVLARQLKLADRLVDQAHLLVGDPEVGVRLVILGGELLLNPLLELAEDLLKGD